MRQSDLRITLAIEMLIRALSLLRRQGKTIFQLVADLNMYL